MTQELRTVECHELNLEMTCICRLLYFGHTSFVQLSFMWGKLEIEILVLINMNTKHYCVNLSDRHDEHHGHGGQKVKLNMSAIFYHLKIR